MKEQVEIYIQGGIAKNNVEIDLLKVQAVYMVPALKDTRTRQKGHGQEQFTGQHKKFDSFLQEAKEELSQESIKCRTNGYTKEAKAFIYQYESKEYKV